MDLEMEVPETAPETTTLLERLSAAASALESAAQRLSSVQLEASTTREHDLEARLAQAEQLIASLQAAAQGNAQQQATRKTAHGTAFLAKEGTSLHAGALEAGTLDAALTSLSLEQRIAVKAQLLRSGLLG